METTTKINLAQTAEGEVKPIDPNALYLIDWNKLESVNDLVLILASMGFSFAGTHPYINDVKKFLNLDNPIYPNGNGTPVKADLNLPKLKTIKPNGQ